LLVLAVSAGLYLWRTAENGAQLLETELNAAVAAETWRTAGSAATVQVQDITYFGDVAGVLVTTTQVDADGRTQTVRQRRFYQTTAAGWTPALPAGHPPLGADQSYTTACCVFAYSRIDAAAVAAIVVEIDAIYADLRQDYGLLPAQERVGVELLTAPPPYPRRCYSRNQVCIGSPALAALPAAVAESEALQLWLLQELVYQVRREALEAAPWRPSWQYAAQALPHLALRRNSTQVAAWERDLASWLYGGAATPDGQRLAQELARLCDAHRPLPQLAEAYGIASLHLCTTPPAWVAPEPPAHLRDLVLPDGELAVTYMTWQGAVAFQTVLDYTIATYGRQALPELVAGFRRYDTWAELIPAVFGVSAAKFEAGWQAYLAAQYAVATDRP
jgi:hypothetical protein